MARRGGAASRAPSLLPPVARSPPLRSCSARAPAASGPGRARRGGRASLERWPSGAPGSPAKRSASRRRRRRRRLPAARPAPGGSGTCSPARPPDSRGSPASPGGPRRFPSPPTFRTKLLKNKPDGRALQDALPGGENVR
ncbi:zinc finger protein 318 [Manis pentadactyla]|uniref:zinc finger protein 318 n=1 Tax=Manis pentadactyla TaxID=143292 RepID=UPI00255CF1FC|nr:zinc finger protein 318 [Manis pentadactyla]